MLYCVAKRKDVYKRQLKHSCHSFYSAYHRSVGNTTIRRIFVFIGENGAGKSTTINLILNELIPDAGEIEVLGKSNLHCCLLYTSQRKSALTGYGPMCRKTASTRPCRICRFPNGRTPILPLIPRSRATAFPSIKGLLARRGAISVSVPMRNCRPQGWPWTGKTMSLFTRPRWTARPR